MLEIIINIVISLLVVAGVLVAYYFDTKRTIQAEVNGAINDAESTGEAGTEKMAMVVDRLYYLVPAMFRPILNKKAIEKIVQMAFDKIEEYAKKQVKKTEN